jgi:hypothetical protein
MTLIGIEKLRSDHDTDTFDCGKPDLNNFLKRFALSNQRSNLSQTSLYMTKTNHIENLY